MRRHLFLLFSLIGLALAVAITPCAAQDKKVGVVLLHGKQGKPPYEFYPLAQKLKDAGYIVSTPEMPWSGARIYDASYEDAMLEIDKAVDDLKKQGASAIFVGGHSLGANVAVGYAARRPGLAGLMVFAPGQFPDIKGFQEVTASSVARAREMVAAGKGDSTDSFDDTNSGKQFKSRASAKIYLSYFDPAGPAVLPANMAAIASPIPILWIVGSRDPLTRPSSYAFDKAPPHPQSKYATVDAGHLETPNKAADEVLNWLRSVRTAS